MAATETRQPSITEHELAAWLRLQHSAGIGPVAARALLARFGLPDAIFEAGFEALHSIVPESAARGLCGAAPPALQLSVEHTLAWLQQPGNAILTLADAAYPKLLLEIHDPPLLIYIKGRIDLLARPALAVVGSRNASAQGVANAAAFSQALSLAGLTIVSGLALGIDTAAHHGGLAGPGSTVAVIGTGIDIVYPRRNLALAHRIADQGCLISEYPLGLPAMPGNFPRRNRLISGLCRGVLVIEAAAQSGSLITARLACEQGRDVFAIPGSIHSALAKGCHALIKQGAKLVESAGDVLQEMQAMVHTNVQGTVPEASCALEDAGLLAALGHDPADADTLAARTGQDAAAVLVQLLNLELAGLLEKLPGGMFQRCRI
ncbi:DNA-processing protein DprA [Janthinobacterium agaricidamnosum]|uniref:DNA protecting protein DprA n=1 Tax=Janthinobacterium agaricidamnosum NBRC 102515 = DSM 9628 TaxID=1349767 RepID=W0VD54_9BURK|nr:DNA-processing protein DprA [Janthinobacterium agaricidamnosum]CDG85232.1 DNA protecting protein DprA [Janthinobacterium agaricidamnosum NBRC 102515 = DSM 9628]